MHENVRTLLADFFNKLRLNRDIADRLKPDIRCIVVRFENTCIPSIADHKQDINTLNKCVQL